MQESALNDHADLIGDIKPKVKRPSGAANRKAKAARLAAEKEARLALLAAQGKKIDPNESDVIWLPRPHQGFLKAKHREGIRRFGLCWHRRSGKSAEAFEFLGERAMERPGSYLFMCPLSTHSRTALWDSRRADGRREIEAHMPRDVVSNVKERDMVIELINGSQIKLLGSDGFDRIVGANFAGVIFDEWALGDPRAWDYISPIINADPEAWACFLSTPRGKNHWWKQFERAKTDPLWATSFLTIDDTFDHEGNPLISQAVIDQERKEGRSEQHIRQEYYCDFISSNEGSVYGGALDLAEKEQRVGAFPYDPALPVVAAFDLGVSDETAVTFGQTKGNQTTIVGSGSWRFEQLGAVFTQIREQFPWGKRSLHVVLPHDGRIGCPEVAEAFGHSYTVLPRTLSVLNDVDLTRGFLNRARIDNDGRPWLSGAPNNERLLEALRGYRYAKAQEEDTFQRNPVHSWHSHYADSTRYLANYFETEATVGSGGWGRKPDYTKQDRARI